jgi:hypothetical protein
VRLGIVFLIALSPLVTNCNCNGRPGGTGGSTGSGGGGGAIGVNSVRTDWTWDRAKIKGTVKSLINSKISFVSLEFELVNDRQMPLYKVDARNDKGIEPNGEWEFEILASHVRARSARLSNTVVR